MVNKKYFMMTAVTVAVIFANVSQCMVMADESYDYDYYDNEYDYNYDEDYYDYNEDWGYSVAEEYTFYTPYGDEITLEEAYGVYNYIYDEDWDLIEVASTYEYFENMYSEAAGGSSSNEEYDEEEESVSSQNDYDEESEQNEEANTKYLGNFTLTAYCNCASCCGTAGNATASGVMPTSGHTVAMGGVDFGTELMINGVRYTVEDRGTPYGHVDIYFDNHSDALAFGMQSADVYEVVG